MKNIARLTAFNLLALLAVACGSAADANAPADPGSAPPEQGPTENRPPEETKPVDPPANAAVNGEALFNSFDEPIANARIDLGNGPAFALTKADGKFELADVPPTYDLTLSVVSGTSTITDRYVGLTTRTPLLESGGRTQSTALKATINGTVPGIGATVPTGKRLRIFARSHWGSPTQIVRYPGDPTTFTLTPEWHGTSERDVTVHAELVTIAANGGFATAFDGVGSVVVKVTDGQVVDNVAPALGSAATKVITGTFDPASFSGGFFAGTIYGDRRDDGYSVFAGDATSPFTILMPDVPGATTYVGFNATYPGALGGRYAIDPNQSISFTVPPAALAVSPDDAAVFTPEMTFTWEAPPNVKGVYRFSLSPKNNNPGKMISVTTTETSVKLPASFIPDAGATYWWKVVYYPDAPSVDALVGKNGWGFQGGVYTTARAVSVP